MYIKLSRRDQFIALYQGHLSCSQGRNREHLSYSQEVGVGEGAAIFWLGGQLYSMSLKKFYGKKIPKNLLW